MPTAPCPYHEAQLADGRPVVGIDEVGRGPLAGPVVAAAVLFRGPVPAGLNDSKRLSAKKREALVPAIQALGIVGIGAVSAALIDQLGIGSATDLAMKRAAAVALRLYGMSDAVLLVDGNRAPGDLPGPVVTEIRADASCPSVAAASIAAKVVRDRALVRLARRYPAYSWHTNKGYGSKVHREAILRLGVTGHHRHSFLTKLHS